MRALPIICALALAAAGCAIPVATTGKGSVEERTTGGKAGSSLAGKGNLAGGNLVAAGAGNLVAAGAGNLTSAKSSAAGIVAAGAGNAVTTNNGGGLVAAGAGNVTSPMAPGANGGGLLDNAKEADVAGPGTVSAPQPNASAAPSPTPSASPLLASPSPGGLADLLDPPAGLGVGDGAGLVGADGASLIGADGASLIGADGGALVVPNGGSFAALDTTDPTQNAPGEVIIDEADEPLTVNVHGTIRGPGALAGRTGTLPVGGAKVGLFALDGSQAAEAVADAKGAYALTGAVPPGLAVVRSTFKVGGRAVYLAAVIDTADAANALDVDPISTLFEGKFFTTTDAKPAGDADFPAWHFSGRPIVDEVTLAQVAPAATLAERATAFDALAAKHPEIGGFAGLLGYLGTM